MPRPRQVREGGLGGWGARLARMQDTYQCLLVALCATFHNHTASGFLGSGPQLYVMSAITTVRFIVFQHRDAVRHSVSASFSMPVWHTR